MTEGYTNIGGSPQPRATSTNSYWILRSNENNTQDYKRECWFLQINRNSSILRYVRVIGTLIGIPLLKYLKVIGILPFKID